MRLEKHALNQRNLLLPTTPINVPVQLYMLILDYAGCTFNHQGLDVTERCDVRRHYSSLRMTPEHVEAFEECSCGDCKNSTKLDMPMLQHFKARLNTLK